MHSACMSSHPPNEAYGGRHVAYEPSHSSVLLLDQMAVALGGTTCKDEVLKEQERTNKRGNTREA